MVLVNPDFLNNELEVVAVQFWLGQDIVKDLYGGFGCAVDLDDGVALVLRQSNLILNPLHTAEQVAFQLVIGGLQRFLLVRMPHNVSDALALGGFQLLLETGQDTPQIFGGFFRLRYVLCFFFQVGVETVQHGGGIFFHLPDVDL